MSSIFLRFISFTNWSKLIVLFIIYFFGNYNFLPRQASHSKPWSAQRVRVLTVYIRYRNEDDLTSRNISFNLALLSKKKKKKPSSYICHGYLNFLPSSMSVANSSTIS